MPLELSKHVKEPEQQHVDRLCPFMSRRITYRDYESGREEELLRQECVESDCAVWDPGNGCCSLSATSRAREGVSQALGDKLDITLHEAKPRPKVKPEKPRKRPAH